MDCSVKDHSAASARSHKKTNQFGKFEAAQPLTQLTYDEVDQNSHGTPMHKRTVKAKKIDLKHQNEVSMEERMKSMALDTLTPTTSTNEIGHARPQTLAVLLVQGLHGDDREILDQVLLATELDHLNDVVRLIPLQSLVPLVQELSRRLASSKQLIPIVKWLRATLTIHMSYFSSFPEIIETLSNHYDMMESRLGLLDRMCRLQGRMKLLLDRAAQKDSGCCYAFDEPLLVVEDESSDDDIELPEHDDVPLSELSESEASADEPSSPPRRKRKLQEEHSDSACLSDEEMEQDDDDDVDVLSGRNVNANHYGEDSSSDSEN